MFLGFGLGSGGVQPPGSALGSRQPAARGTAKPSATILLLFPKGGSMPKDLTVILEGRPGSLATLGEILGRAGVNIEGICAFTSQGKGEIHILVEEAAKASGALRASGMQVLRETEVMVRDFKDRPGELGNTARRLAGSGVNIEVA